MKSCNDFEIVEEEDLDAIVKEYIKLFPNSTYTRGEILGIYGTAKPQKESFLSSLNPFKTDPEVANINNIVLSLNDNPITNLNLSYSGLTIGNATDQTIVVKGISLNKFGALQLNLIIDGKEETKAYGSNYGNALTKAGFDIKKLLKESQ